MKLFQEIQQIQADYSNSPVDITETLSYSQPRVINTVIHYSDSKYLYSNLDSTGREKPFYNIVNAMVETAVVATDLDTKDIRVEAEKPNDYVRSMLFNHEIKNWMKDVNFAKTLNDMGETRARYGGLLVKKSETEDGELKMDVVEWKNVCTSQTDVAGGTVIEKHYMTPVELKSKEGVWDNIDQAIKLYSKKGYTKTEEGIEVWEVHGEFAEEYLDDPETDITNPESYERQVHFFAVKGSKSVCMYSAPEKENPYKYLAWKKRVGLPLALGRGVVEEGQEAQVWTNDAIQKEQSAMELSGKVVLKTNSKKIGNNILTDWDNGSVIPLEDGKDLNVVNLLNGALPQFQNMVSKWWTQYERATSSYDAIRGETPPSGQPYRLQALIQNSSASQFDYRREEWGIFLKELFYDWVFPYVKKKLNKKHILASDFSQEELMKIDDAFAQYESNKKAIEMILNGKIITKEEYMAMQTGFADLIGETGQRRFIEIPDGFFKDMKGRLDINITGEEKNKTAMMESLSSILTSVATNPQILQDPNLLTILNKIIEMSGSGLSPLSLGVAQNQPKATPSPLPESKSDLAQLQQGNE
jgi:hypothetical protein